MQEIFDDAVNIEEDKEVEEEVEVDKVLFELTNGKLGQAGTVDTQLPVSTLLPGELFSHRNILCRLLRSTRNKQRGRWDATGNSSTVYSSGGVRSDYCPVTLVVSSYGTAGTVLYRLQEDPKNNVEKYVYRAPIRETMSSLASWSSTLSDCVTFRASSSVRAWCP
jgi:hypothetical protein